MLDSPFFLSGLLMDRLEISLLGPLKVTVDGKPVTQFEADTARALLAYLALHADVLCRRETLAGLLWPEQPEAEARHNLRQALSRLRHAIGDRSTNPPFLLITRQTIQLNPEADTWLDVAAFDDLIAACQGHRHRRLEACRSCMRRLGEAVELYQGDLLSGFFLSSEPFEEWLVAEREQRHRQTLDALRHLAAYHERRGDQERVQDYARRQLALEPWQEEAHRQLMRALALSGQRTAALAQYETCYQVLLEELGVEPDRETTALYECIRDGTELTTLSRAPPHNLPVPVTPFVGREAEMAEIEEHLGDPDCRLLTLVGPGGIGKTHLALEAASAQVDGFQHGVFFVPLAPLQSADAIVPTVARALDFSFYTGAASGVEVESRQQLLDYLRQKSMLLVLDNYEHLLSLPARRTAQRGGTDLVIDILRTAPDVIILVTSRERLNVQGEYLFPVAGMDYPEETALCALREEPIVFSAVQLFLHSARRVQPDFEPVEEDLAQVGRICRLVEGMPLGILLAASLMEVLTPTEIAAEVEQGIDILATDLRDTPARQRSIRALFDHSWKLLTEREQDVLQALSVFRGGFTRQAAQAITGVSLRDLMALTHKSLLRRTASGQYDLWHDLLRQYTLEKLAASGQAAAVRNAHSAYYATALQQWGEGLKGPRQLTALTEMEVDIENARAAWDWAVEQGQIERFSQTVDGLCRFYTWRRRYQEGEAACRTAAEKLVATASGDGRQVWVKILTWQSVFSQALGHTEIAGQLLQQSLALLERSELADQDIRQEKAFVLERMGALAHDSDLEKARRLYEQCLELFQELGDQWGTANTLRRLGSVARGSGVYDKAKQLVEDSLAIRRVLGDQEGIIDSLGGLEGIARKQGQLEEAERLVREIIAIHQITGGQKAIADDLRDLGVVLVFAGKFSEAHSLMEASLAIYSDLGQNELAWSNGALGYTKVHLGRYEQAHVQGQLSLTLAREIGYRYVIGAALLVLGWVALAEEAYTEAQGLLQESAAVRRESGQQDELGVAFASLGYAARGLGNIPQARQHLSKALRVTADTGARWPLMYALPAIALLLADQGQKERAVEIYALASRYPFVANSRWFEDVAGKHIAAVAAALPPEVVAAAQERGRARDLDETVKELLVELEEQQGPDTLE
jgi:predicted ATPase/DNA-binding SARP family transcriptional activator